MNAESSGVFTLKEINRVKVIQDVIERRLTTDRAAELLDISDRQCRRLLVRYREEGPLCMARHAWQPAVDAGVCRTGSGTHQDALR